MRCRVTWSSLDLIDERGELLGLEAGLVTVRLDGDPREMVLPVESIDRAGCGAEVTL